MRFSLKALAAVILVICVLCALLFSVPNRFGLFLLFVISLHLPTALAVGIIYFDKNIRAFCIGAAAAALNAVLLSLLYSSSMVLEEVSAFLLGVASTDAVDDQLFGKLLFVYLLGSCLTGGGIGVMTRYLSLRRQNRVSGQEPEPETGSHLSS